VASQGQTKHQQAWRRASPGRSPSATRRDGLDYYRLLGVPYNATPADITGAYRQAMKLHHPDRQIGQGYEDAEELAKSLNQAYATLSNPVKRRAYDQTIRNEVVNEQIMNRYVGGFTVPDRSQDILDPHAPHLRRNLTTEELRDQRSANRRAMISLGVAFGGLFLTFFCILLLYALISSVANAIFWSGSPLGCQVPSETEAVRGSPGSDQSPTTP